MYIYFIAIDIDIFVLLLFSEYHMSSYQPKSPLPMGTSLATAKKLFQSDNLQNETADSNSTLSTLPSQARFVLTCTLRYIFWALILFQYIIYIFQAYMMHDTWGGINLYKEIPKTVYNPGRAFIQFKAGGCTVLEIFFITKQR